MDLRIFVLLAALCSPSGQQCQDKEIASSDSMPNLNDLVCNTHGQMIIQEWMEQHRGYRDWNVERYGCIRVKYGEKPVLTQRF